MIRGSFLVQPGTPRPTIYTWLFQLDDSQSLHWLEITKHLFINGWPWGSRKGDFFDGYRDFPSFAETTTATVRVFAKRMLVRKTVESGEMYLHSGTR